MTVRRIPIKSGNGGTTASNVSDIESARRGHGGQETIRDASKRQADAAPQKAPDLIQELNLPHTICYEAASKHLDEPGWYSVEIGKKPPKIDIEPKVAPKRRKPVKSKDEELFARIVEIRNALQANALKETGTCLWEDINGCIEALAIDACDNNSKMDIKSLIDRLGDLIRPFYGPKTEDKWPRHYDSSSDFLYFLPDEKFVSDCDELPTAGSILADDSRVIKDKVYKTTADYRAVCDDLEPYIVGIGALRYLGWDAHLAIAKSKEEMEFEDGTRRLVDTEHPVAAIFDPAGDIPLYTTVFAPNHPPATAFEIFSDKELLSLMHALRAQMRIRRMIRDMKVRENYFDETIPLSDDSDERKKQMDDLSRPGPMTVAEMGKHIVEIAESLFESFRNSDKKKFFLNAFMYARNNVFETIVAVRSHRIAQKLGKTFNECVIEAKKFDIAWQNANIFKKIWLWLFVKPKFTRLINKDKKNVGKAIDAIIDGINANLQRLEAQHEAAEKSLPAK